MGKIRDILWDILRVAICLNMKGRLFNGHLTLKTSNVLMIYLHAEKLPSSGLTYAVLRQTPLQKLAYFKNKLKMRDMFKA